MSFQLTLKRSMLCMGCTHNTINLFFNVSLLIPYNFGVNFRKEIKEGAAILTEKILKYKPKIAVFNGKGLLLKFLLNTCI